MSTESTTRAGSWRAPPGSAGSRRASRWAPAIAGLLAAVLAAGLAAAPARADHQGLNPPWPEALPPLPGGHVQPVRVPRCQWATIRCVGQLIRRLRAQWQRLDRRCEHRAAPTLAYLRINQELRRELLAPDSIFRHEQWFYRVVADFSNRYFRELGRYRRGEPVPRSWRIAFDAWERGELTAGQDVLLFSNAHVQHDLPLVYAKMGQRGRLGASRKPDHDAFNEINNRILDPVNEEVAERYDPFMSTISLSPSPLDELGAIETVKMWRELSWRNGERLLRAETREERQRVYESIDDNATAWARMIASFEMAGHRDRRRGHCMEGTG